MITAETYKDKAFTLGSLREIANAEIDTVFSSTKDKKKRATQIGKIIKNEFSRITNLIENQARASNWSNENLLLNKLNLNYCYNLAMIEYRQLAWPYEYMAFSRRIGELWEPFCKLCFDFPVKPTINLYEPPKFSQVKQILSQNLDNILLTTELSEAIQQQLKDNYNQVWGLVTSGEISTELDLHFMDGDTHYNIDFKSGFNSNEKGNTNRLLLVASIYKTILPGNHECSLFVRAKEEDNNHYLQTLKNSPHWNVYCGQETYNKIEEYSGFNLSGWIDNNLSWLDDLNEDTKSYLEQNELVKYLTW